MVFVQGGRYTPSFFGEEREVKDLFVRKYQTTQIRLKEMMGTDPSYFKGDRRPVEQIKWIEALEYCNKLSEHYGLQPVYKIENDKLVAIIHNDGEEVYPDLADFSKTEGYRLPTELEWEWFARGGEVAFNIDYSGSNNLDEVAWYDKNSQKQTHDVGSKKPNQLGIYDCSGNVCEWCYDTTTGGYLLEERPYVFDESGESRRLRGGSWYDYCYSCVVDGRSRNKKSSHTFTFTYYDESGKSRRLLVNKYQKTFLNNHSSIDYRLSDSESYHDYGLRVVRTV